MLTPRSVDAVLTLVEKLSGPLPHFPAHVSQLERHYAVIADLCREYKRLTKPQTIVLEVEGGYVSDVSGLPDGWDYVINDLDDQES